MARTAYRVGSLFVTLLVLVGAGCLGGGQVTQRPPTKTTTNEETLPPKVYTVNETATVGDIVHKVTDAEQMDVISASETLPEWELIAEALSADEGFQWVHITGEVTNKSKKTQTVDSTSMAVLDENDNSYSVSTDTTIYVDTEKSPIYITVQPTQTVEWEGYFEVPANAKELQLRVSDLNFLSDQYALIDLGL